MANMFDRKSEVSKIAIVLSTNINKVGNEILLYLESIDQLLIYN